MNNQATFTIVMVKKFNNINIQSRLINRNDLQNF